MPTKFVQNVAHKTGTSIEHAEKVWHDAKEAVHKGKRQGSWYWGKVVNTFKKMMGLKEHISFSEFSELLESEKRGPSIPQGMKNLPQKIMLGQGGYYMEVEEIKPMRAILKLKRLLDNDSAPGITMTITRARPGGLGKDTDYMLQAHGSATLALDWSQRSKIGSLEDLKPFEPAGIKKFMLDVLSAMGKLNEDKKEDGIKKSYLDFKGSSHKKELKGEMKREIKRFSKMDHKDKDAYPDDWTADQKYKAELKKKGKELPKSSHTDEYHRRYGK